MEEGAFGDDTTDAFKAGAEKGRILDLSMKANPNGAFNNIIDPRVRATMDATTIDELIKNRKTIKHYALDGVIDY